MPELVHESKFQDILLAIDRELAARSRAQGCPHCGGVLHSACYPRLLRGAPGGGAASATTRHSLCCQTCRRRLTPPSVRFFGRRRYSTVSTLALLAVKPGGDGKARQDQIRRLLGVSRRTLNRWRRWWRETFVQPRSGASPGRGSCRPCRRRPYPVPCWIALAGTTCTDCSICCCSFHP